MLGAELTRQAEYMCTCRLEAACAHTTAELSALCECHTDIGVLREWTAPSSAAPHLQTS
jgi:hypothetical protein